METQERGAPHLHGAILSPVELTARDRALIVKDWVEVARDFGPSPRRQRVDAIGSAEGWSRYVAKHSARSAGHAQRREIPPGWETSGRLWGHSSGWVIRGVAYRLSPRATAEMRRLLASWRKADAATRLHVAEGMPCRTDDEAAMKAHRIRSARYAVKAARSAIQGAAGIAAVRGMREWVAEDVQELMLGWLRREGYGVLEADVWEARRAAELEARGLLQRAERRLLAAERLGLDLPGARAELDTLRSSAAMVERVDLATGILPAKVPVALRTGANWSGARRLR